MTDRPSFDPDAFTHPLREQFDVFIDEQRVAMEASLEGLTDEQARRHLVTSRTTLLGLVKHATFVEPTSSAPMTPLLAPLPAPLLPLRPIIKSLCRRSGVVPVQSLASLAAT